ncbi:hypothetical protein DACRYDRAFT_22644, partial [Dacryopinax primogenitus]
MVDTLTDSSVFRFHPLHFTVHGHPQSTPRDSTPGAMLGPGDVTRTDLSASVTHNSELATETEPLPAYTLTLPRLLQAHLPFPSWVGRAEASLLAHTAQYGPTQRYAPLCHHPNASCTLATVPPSKELKLPFRILGQRRIVEVRNQEGVTLLDLSRALVDTVLAEPDNTVYNTVMETYGARDDIVSFGLVTSLRDRGFMNDHEWPLIELLDEYDYGDADASWDGYWMWVDHAKGAV